MDVDLWWYQARAVRVTDGDTVVFEFDKGMRDRSEEAVRVDGVDTAELFSGTNRVEGAAAKLFVADWILARNDASRWPFLVHTKKDTQTFNRYIAEVFDRVTGESLQLAIESAGFDISET